ncbi:hypothetical protein [Rhizobium laguerreae]|uniref:hypothetical protein n=1 Tax=Rhizobium laguerreae TaxID=1076926 RepID=UPI001C90E6DB|nr:hypothetical protein [Rhizobium laguerreae]MBY3378912.1 hypothetical protein [Rhizobium laguerreae]
MTKGNPAPEANWKLLVRSLKGTGTLQGRMLVEKAILEAAGLPLRLRQARRRLFILTTSASEGRPAIIEAESGLVCVIALDDLVDVVMEKGPMLGEVIERGRNR